MFIVRAQESEVQQMKYIRAAIIAVSLVSLISCATLRQEEIDPWLAAMSGDKPAAANFEGKWQDPESFSAKSFIITGWGHGYMRQNHNKLKGVIGSYNVKGIVSGEIVYLVFYTGGTVYYTARLEMFEKGVLEGEYFEADDREQKKDSPTKFKITQSNSSI
jgi:hypothetical protein